MKSEKDPGSNIFTDETMESLVALGEVLREIRTRLLSEGYTIKDGKIIKPISKD